MERWALCVGCLVVFAAALAAGWRLGRRGRKAATIAIAVCVLALGVRVVFRFAPGLEHALLPLDAYALLRPWWAIPFALATLGAGAHHMSTERTGRALLAFAAVLWLVAAHRLVVTARFDGSTVTGRVERNGVCQQTTDYTCGAAAAATLLHAYGVEADEREMAERCWTNALTGTDELCVARGLRQKALPIGRRAVVGSMSYDELVARGEPVMVTVGWSLLVDHWVVVLRAEPTRVLVGDPLHGRVHYGRDEFVAKWRGVTVTLEE